MAAASFDDARETEGVAGGGPDKHGEEVVFAFRVGPDLVWLRCQYGRLAGIIDRLRAFGGMAAQARAHQALPGAIDELIFPYRLKGQPAIGHAPDGHIGLRFPTEAGLPLTIAMDRAAAQSFAERLLAECLKAPPEIRRQ